MAPKRSRPSASCSQQEGVPQSETLKDYPVLSGNQSIPAAGPDHTLPPSLPAPQAAPAGDVMEQMLLLIQQQQQTLATHVGMIAPNLQAALPVVPAPRPTQAHEEGMFERFQRLRPPTFAGSINPLEAEHWLRLIVKMIEPLRCTEAKQVELATFAFEKEADLWWDSVLRTVSADFVWTWAEFESRFFEKYFPLTCRKELESQFIQLQQGNMSVFEYENQFTELSMYATKFVSDEQSKMRRFEDGLRPGIRAKTCCSSVSTYTEMVHMALRSEKDGERITTARLQMASKSKQELPPPYPSARRPRLLPQPSPSPKLDIVCTYCGRPGHYMQFCYKKMKDEGITTPQQRNRPL